MATSPAHLESVPISLVVPLCRVAEGLGTTADYTMLDAAAHPYGDKLVAAWLVSVETVVAARVGRAPRAPEAWVEDLELGRETRRRASFVWEDAPPEAPGDLLSSLVSPGGSEAGYCAALHAGSVSGGLPTSACVTWTVSTRDVAANGIVYGTGPKVVTAAKRQVEHVFFAMWEAVS